MDKSMQQNVQKRLYRQKNAEFCAYQKHCKFKILNKDELFIELESKFEEKLSAPLEKIEEHILRGSADILQISKDILSMLEIDYSKLLKEIKIENRDTSLLMQDLLKLAKGIKNEKDKYKLIVKICSGVVSLASLKLFTLQDIENERVKIEEKEGSYLNGFLILENK